MSTTFRVKVLRAFRVRGDQFLPGAVVALAPLDAHAVVGVKAELLDPNDHEVIKAAVSEATRAALLLAGRHRADDSFGPWQRR